MAELIKCRIYFGIYPVRIATDEVSQIDVKYLEIFDNKMLYFKLSALES
jgi:hypothetical protein